MPRLGAVAARSLSSVSGLYTLKPGCASSATLTSVVRRKTLGLTPVRDQALGQRFGELRRPCCGDPVWPRVLPRTARTPGERYYNWDLKHFRQQHRATEGCIIAFRNSRVGMNSITMAGKSADRQARI